MFSSIDPIQIRQKARIDHSDYDQDIYDLIQEMDLVVQGQLQEGLDTTNQILKATLELGFKEVVAGTFLQSLAAEDSGGSFTAGIVKIDEGKGIQERAKRGSELEDKGWQRLKPYLKPSDFFGFGVV